MQFAHPQAMFILALQLADGKKKKKEAFLPVSTKRGSRSEGSIQAW